MIAMEGMVSRINLCYPRYYLTSDICNLINFAAMEENVSFPAQIHTILL